MLLRRAWHRPAGLVFLYILSLCLAPQCSSGPIIRGSPYDLVLKTVDDGRFNFANMNGKVFLVTFFSTWCLPCMLDVPNLSKLQKEHSEQGFAVIGVGMDKEGKKVLKPFVNSYRVPYTILIADDYLRSGEGAYGPIEQLPMSYLIDRNGKLVAAWSGAVNLSELEKILAGLL